MGWIAPVMMGLSGLAGLFGNKQKQQQMGTQNQQGGSETNYGSTPTLNPLASQGYQAISDKYMNLIGQDPNLSGYQAQQTGNINRTSDLQEQQLREQLAAKGITGPAAETAIANSRSQGFAQKVQLQQQIPLMARQLQEQTLGNAGQFYRGMPTGMVGTQGQNQWGSTQQQGTIQTGVNPLSGLFGGLGNVLGLLSGMGMLGGGSGNQGNQNVGGGGFNP